MARLEIEAYDGPEVDPRIKRQAKVTLSRRNLFALLHKLDMEGSARRLENNCVYIEGEGVWDLILVLRCEEDEEHYNDARRAGATGIAGPMHPETEAFITERMEDESSSFE